MSRKTDLPAVLARWALAGLSLAPLACNRSTPGVYPYKGQVFVRGQPAAGAAVTFYPLHPEKPHYIPVATVGPDGAFSLTSVSANDGAPPGEYAVTVVWSDTFREDGETRNGPDRLQWRYAYPTASGLKATVQAGKNPPARFDLN